MAATSAHTVTSEHPVCAKCAEPYLPKGGKPSAVTLCYHCWRMLIITLWLVTTVRTSPPPEHTHYAALHHTHHDKQQFNGEQNHRAPLSPQSSVILPVLHNVCLSPCMCARVRVLTSRMNVQQDIRRARARTYTDTQQCVKPRWIVLERWQSENGRTHANRAALMQLPLQGEQCARVRRPTTAGTQDGKQLRLELHPLFSYLQTVSAVRPPVTFPPRFSLAFLLSFCLLSGLPFFPSLPPPFLPASS